MVILSIIGSTHLHRPAIFSDGETRSEARKLLPTFCFVSIRRYAASHRRPSDPVLPGKGLKLQHLITDLANPLQTNGTNMTNMGTVDDATLTWMLVNGSAMLNASELDGQKLAPYEGNVPPSGPSDVTQLFAIGQTDVVTWVINSQPFSEPQRPILYGNASDGWDAVTTLHMPSNSTIDLIMYVATDSMDTVGCLPFSMMPR